MSRFKLSLSANEMGFLAAIIARLGSTGKALTIEELARYEAWESVYNKMKRMYRPDKKKFTLRLSSVEASAMWNLICVAMSCGFWDRALMAGVVLSLEKQIDNELSIYNYNRN